VFMSLARSLTNVSLQFLNYPTQVIFKSMKLLTAMIGAVFYLNNKHSADEWISAILMVTSATMFSLGDSATMPAFDPTGIIIVLISLVFDSLHSNSQEYLVKGLNTPSTETLLWTNLLACVITFSYDLIFGDLIAAVRFCGAHLYVYPYWIGRCCFVYYGVKCFLTIVKLRGNVFATGMTTVRKIISILLSFVIFPKPFVAKYMWGLVAFFGSAMVSYFKPSAANSALTPTAMAPATATTDGSSSSLSSSSSASSASTTSNPATTNGMPNGSSNQPSDLNSTLLDVEAGNNGRTSSINMVSISRTL